MALGFDPSTQENGMIISSLSPTEWNDGTGAILEAEVMKRGEHSKDLAKLAVEAFSCHVFLKKWRELEWNNFFKAA
jgi:hypothetical protein